MEILRAYGHFKDGGGDIPLEQFKKLNQSVISSRGGEFYWKSQGIIIVSKGLYSSIISVSTMSDS